MQVGCGAAEVRSFEGVSLGRLQRDLGRVYFWSGSFWADYAFFIANWHPLVGIFLSHPWHPWSKKERIGMLIFSVPLTMLGLALKCHHADFERQLAIYVGVTLPVMLVESVLYQLAVLEHRFRDRFQDRRRCGCLCRGVCRRVMILARILRYFAFSTAIAASLVVAALVFLWLVPARDCNVRDLVVELLISRLQSWVTWFPIWFLLPCRGFLAGWSADRPRQR
eukprot:UN0849